MSTRTGSAPGPSQPAPNGTESNLRVLPWAGFAAAVTYTFDDSQPSHLEHFGALNGLGVPFTFYVNPSQNRQAACSFTVTLTGVSLNVRKFLAFGDVHAEGQLARGLVCGLIVFNVVVVASLVRAYTRLRNPSL